MTRLAAALLALAAFPVAAQEIFDIVLRGGHVLDPKNGRNQPLDIAVTAGRIRRIAPHIPAAHARTAVDLSGYYVTPGLIDMHAYLGGTRGVIPGYNALRYGVTTIVDAGSAEANTFGAFRKEVVDGSPVRVLAVVAGADKALIEKHAGIIVTPGRIETGIFGLNAPPPAKLQDARRRGALLLSDRLWFRIAAPAIEQGLLPDIIATGLDRDTVLLERATMTNVMSKFLALGLTLEQVVERTTAAPARALHRSDMGSLEEGGVADIAVLELRKGPVALLDSGHARLTAARELRCVLTVRNGKIVWDTPGLSLTDWKAAGPYSNFK